MPRRICSWSQQRAVLLEHQNRLARGIGARRRARGVQLHQRQQTVGFGLVRRDRSQHAAHAKRFMAELRTQPMLAARRGIAFVEDEIDDFEHGGEPFRQLFAARRLVGQPRFGKRPLGAHDALGDGRIRHQEGPRDLLAWSGRRSSAAPAPTRASRDSSGWQAVKISRSISSPMSSSSAASRSGIACCSCSMSRATMSCLRASMRPRRR